MKYCWILELPYSTTPWMRIWDNLSVHPNWYVNGYSIFMHDLLFVYCVSVYIIIFIAHCPTLSAYCVCVHTSQSYYLYVLITSHAIICGKILQLFFRRKEFEPIRIGMHLLSRLFLFSLGLYLSFREDYVVYLLPYSSLATWCESGNCRACFLMVRVFIPII